MTDRYILPLELRASPDETDGRTLEGLIVPYGETVDLGDSLEAFAAGVFSDVDPASVVLLWQHDTTAPIGRMTGLSETETGAFGTFHLADTERSREARSLIDDGIVRGLSVGFEPGETKTIRGVKTHTRARLRETSLVTFPAYPSAGVVAVRKGDIMEDAVDTVEEASSETTGDLLAPLEEKVTTLGAELREVRNDLANITVTAEGPPVLPMTLGEAFGKLMKAVAEKPSENRALADVIGTGTGNAEGLVYNQFVAELLGAIDNRRPLFSAAGTVAFPTSGYGLVFPRRTQSTQVAKRSGEKTPVASRELTVTQATYTMEWFAGAVDVSLELISQSDPSVLAVIADDLLDQYAIATEDEFVNDAEAASTATGDTLDVATWSAFVADVVSGSAQVRAATGAPGNLLALTSASWSAILQLLNPSQPSISFGAGPDFVDESVNVGGITAFHSPYSSVDLQFNARALRKSERPPVTVSATNVALMGRDIGIIGATIALPLYPAGILRHAAAA